MDELHLIVGQLYHEIHILQRKEAVYDQALRKKDEEIALLKQKLKSLTEDVKDGPGQRTSDK